MAHQQFEPPSLRGMPALGLGTWQNDDPAECTETVAKALEMGYRHVDTAQAYGNEEAVGRGIDEASVDRDEVFLATKVWHSELGREDCRAAAESSLERLGTDYVDLLYVHWPAGAYDPAETLGAFADLRDDGMIDRIGVSNFEPDHLERAREVLGEVPFANQVEMHPLLPQEELRTYAAETELELVAYSPLARGTVFDAPQLTDVAEAHGVSEAQVSLAWLREKGVAAIPKATGENHLRDNWESLGVDLTDEDVATIDDIRAVDRQVHPDFAPDSWE